ncbi:cysteine peptidase family C39 domain-containing protein [Dongia sp.]|uniref:cysteine peptidase family C39 domain-containing protein n=1 Tax=Dongia sp. TaxID=1977262 RepID=UPI0035AFB2C3
MEPQALRHRFAPGPEGLSDSDLLRAARESGLKARWVASDWRKLAKTPLPAVAQSKDGRFFVLAKVAAGEGQEVKALVHDPEENRPVALTRAELEKAWTWPSSIRPGCGGRSAWCCRRMCCSPGRSARTSR